MAAAKKTPSAAKKVPAKKVPAKKAVSRRPEPTPAELEDLVFEGLIWRYTRHQDWDRVEDIFDLYGHILADREDEQS